MDKSVNSIFIVIDIYIFRFLCDFSIGCYHSTINTIKYRYIFLLKNINSFRNKSNNCWIMVFKKYGWCNINTSIIQHMSNLYRQILYQLSNYIQYYCISYIN